MTARPPLAEPVIRARVTPPARTPPDLQQLIARHGRFDLVPVTAWAIYDREMEKFYDAVRHDRPYRPPPDYPQRRNGDRS